MIIKNPPNRIIDPNGVVIKCRKYDIGAWNMDTTDVVELTHGLDRTKILMMQARILDDLGQYSDDLVAPDVDISTAGACYADDTTIYLDRTLGGYFDSTDWDDAVMNRGYVLVWYIE